MRQGRSFLNVVLAGVVALAGAWLNRAGFPGGSNP
jgi:hypothetical protein